MKTKHDGIRISGDWFCSGFKKDFDMDYRLTIKQMGNRIGGRLWIEKRHQGKIESSETLNLIINGIILEGYLAFTAKSVDLNRPALDSDLFEIKEGGKKLLGVHSYRSLNRGGVKQIKLTFSRSRNSKWILQIDGFTFHC